MLVDIDSKNGNEYIIEELDEEHLLVKDTKVNELKSRLNQVCVGEHRVHAWLTTVDDEGKTQRARKLRFRIDLI